MCMVQAASVKTSVQAPKAARAVPLISDTPSFALARDWRSSPGRAPGRNRLAYTIACRGSGSPGDEAHGVSGPGRRAIAGNIIDVAKLEIERRHGSGERQPVLDLGRAGLEMRFAEPAELLDIAAA